MYLPHYGIGDSAMCGYVCLFMGKRFECQATSLWDAKQKAIAHFKPSKAKMGLLSVTLAETEAGSVVHTPE